MAGNVKVVCGYDPVLAPGSLTKAVLVQAMTDAGHIGGSVANQSVHSIRDIVHPKTKEVQGLEAICPADISTAVKATMGTVLGCTVDVILPTPMLAINVSAIGGTSWTDTGSADMTVRLVAGQDSNSAPQADLGHIDYVSGTLGTFVDDGDNDVILAPFLYMALQSFDSGVTFTIPKTPKTSFTVDGKTFNLELSNDIVCTLIGPGYGLLLYLDSLGRAYIGLRGGDGVLPSITIRSFRDAVVANPNGI